MTKIRSLANSHTPPSKKITALDALKEDLEKQLSSKEKLNMPKRKRPYLGAGAYSVALENGHKKILLVTPLSAAKGIELVKKSFARVSKAERQNWPFELPNLVEINKPLHLLMNLASDQSLNHAKGTYLANVSSKIINGTENVVYELTRYDGTLEDFKENIRFKQSSVDMVAKIISEALDILHKQNITHGDVALRNIFYTGSYPHFKFYLGDFGSAKMMASNSKKKGSPDIEKDKENLNFVIKQLHEKLEKNPPSPEKKKDILFQFNAQSKTTSSTTISPTLAPAPAAFSARTKLSF